MQYLISSLAVSVLCVHSLYAELVFSQTEEKVDAAADAKEVNVEFPFENKGDEPVVVQRFDAPCSCMYAHLEGGKKQQDGSILIAPDEKGVFKGRFELGNFKGTVEKKIVIWMDQDPDDKPSISLNTQVTIPYLIAAFPQSLMWQVGENAVEKIIEVKVDHTEPIKVIKHTSSSSNFSYTFTIKEEGKLYELKVKPKSTEKVTFAAIRLTTDSANPRYKTVQTFMTVKPEKK
ncbi:DUF1573 domain-containing protein [Rubritalea spongiae]|uniref:DUF1573 domain-containing protein n=1 Tax=Rubritalea spongiae TaxID=430797 RepID=A0ABW5E8X0_9BACT